MGKPKLLNFFDMPTIGKRKCRHAKATGGALTFRREEGSHTVGVPTAEATMRVRADGRRVLTLRIGHREEHINKFRDTRRHVTAQHRRALTNVLRAMKRKYGAYRLDAVINCSGGATAVAMGYAQALKRWRGEKRCLIEGECSSAATLIAYLPDWEITVTPGSSSLVHRAKKTKYVGAVADGVKRWAALPTATNGTTDRQFETVYHRRTGRDREAVRGWMDRRKRFTAPEMCMLGLADQMMPGEEWRHAKD